MKEKIIIALLIGLLIGQNMAVSAGSTYQDFMVRVVDLLTKIEANTRSK